MQIHSVEGGGGLKLHLREWGNSTAPAILFIHGWSQNHLCWFKQFEGPLVDDYRIVAMDIRGHGQSEAPLDVESYTTGILWADDLRRVIGALKLDAPILVGWSYGGLIICDYLREYGDDAIGGINFVSAAVGIGEEWFGSRIGPGFLEYAPSACSEDQTVALKAIRDFVHTCIVKPVAVEDMELAVGWNMLVHPQVRANLIGREEDFTPDLARVKKPVLITYGTADTVILPSMARAISENTPNSETSEYPEVGHAPFIEEPNRFNKELATFVRRTVGAG